MALSSKQDTQLMLARLHTGICDLLQEQRQIQDSVLRHDISVSTIPELLAALTNRLVSLSRAEEAQALQDVREKTIESVSFGGLGLNDKSSADEGDFSEVLFLSGAWLEALNSSARALPLETSRTVASGRYPMTVAEKIFAQHAVSGCPQAGLGAGDVVNASIDWVLASELSWSQMSQTHEKLGRPAIWRNDRFWLAGDHVVHPNVLTNERVRAMVETAERAKKDFKMTEYQGMNYTIMHTEFVRERAEPGMLVIGSDSHTCSAGAMGSLAIGLGTADVMMALTLGQNWFKVPESIRIEFVGRPSQGMTGKDVIMYILKQLRRNTVASQRIVEFGGDGMRHLSCDARFAIANMCTEFGAVTGIFEPDAVTKAYVARRKRKANKSNSLYFMADPAAKYAGKYTIDLSAVEASVAVYPSPDHVVSVSGMADMRLDGVFIGACTTTEEELVLAALVLKVGLSKGLPQAKGRRHYVPGSLPIVEKLRKLDLLSVYEAAGFTRGPPGCSFCVGLSADKAAEGETWLSSQNRNFENRMGKGAFGHVTSAVVCAASSFSMTIKDPAPFLANLDIDFFEQYRGLAAELEPPTHVEPSIRVAPASDLETSQGTTSVAPLGQIRSKIVRLGDFIDTDALAPGSTLTTCTTDEEFGEHVLEHTHPEFRDKVRAGHQVVVAGHAFGVGSSRECAVQALKGIGVKAVIAKEFAFIYGRNQPSLGLLGFTMTDEQFYTSAEEGQEILIDVDARQVEVDGCQFPFELSAIEYNLTINHGIADAFARYGDKLWKHMAIDNAHNESDIIEAAASLTQPRSQMDW